MPNFQSPSYLDGVSICPLKLKNLTVESLRTIIFLGSIVADPVVLTPL